MPNESTSATTTPSVLVYSAMPYDERTLADSSDGRVEFSFIGVSLNPRTAALAEGYNAVCAFVNDDIGSATLHRLAALDVKVVAMRCTGLNNVDLDTAAELGIAVVNVPGYSPHAVAEHTMALILSLNRGTHRAHNRVREQNFSLVGLLGFNLHQRTMGIVGTGEIGAVLAKICVGFGMNVLAFDLNPSAECEALGVTYTSLDELIASSDIISLHVPHNPKTHHLIGEAQIAEMRQGVMIINTSRGALIDTKALVEGLKSGQVGHVGLDVYEEEGDLFFRDLSSEVITDDVFSRLLTFPNVLVTGHQAFFTEEALAEIASTTVNNIVSHLEAAVG